MTIVDDGTREKGMACAPFDGEGVPTQKRVIVEKGILRGFLYNSAVAKRAGVESTGNASRGGFDSLPGHRAAQLLHGGRERPSTTTSSQPPRPGSWLKSVTGYGINPVNGQFSGGAAGFWIENGKIAFPVQGLTIAGTADEILNGIDMMADDLDLSLSLAAPTVRIKVLQIGGE